MVGSDHPDVTDTVKIALNGATGRSIRQVMHLLPVDMYGMCYTVLHITVLLYTSQYTLYHPMKEQ